MSDLIDLNSPEKKKLRPELASPLIPSPENDSPKPTSLNLSNSRKSMDNNPFDMVLRKTSEYVSKSSDPFEIVFDRATKITPETELQNMTVLSDFTDDLQMIKKIRHSDILKINKTLDESLLNTIPCVGTPKDSKRKSKKAGEEVPSILVEPPSPCDNLSILDQSAMNDSLRTFSDRLSMSKNFPALSEASGALEKSILNNSAMNDSLSTSEGSSDDCFIKSLIAQRVSMCIKKGTLDAELLDADNNDNNSYKNHKLRRSFSQGDRLSPRKFRTKRSVSTVNDRNFLSNENSVHSILFEDPLNIAFMTRHRSDYSIGSDYSELSNITRLNSVNSGSFFSGKSSNDSANKAFIDSSGLSGNERTTSRGSDSNFKDLLARFNSLRMKSIEDESIKLKESLSKCDDNDSVFLEDDNSKKSSIFSQANILAKTFEDLAEESARGSSSSGENLMSTRLPSNFELSPETSTTANHQSTSNTSVDSIRTPADPANKEAAATLLRDLENVVKTQDNPEIMKLLKNLEKALGVKSENNLQLLHACRQPTNESTSPSKMPIVSPTNAKSSPTVKFTKTPTKNQQMEIDSEFRFKSPLIMNNSAGKIQNEQNQDTKEIAEINNHEESGSNEDKSTTQESEKSTEDNTEPGTALEDSSNLNINPPDKSTKIFPESRPQDSFTTQKLILDIQLALGKLLEDCKDEPALVLENLNKVLTPKPTKHSPSPRKSGLPYRSLKSLGHQLPEPQKNLQKTSSKPFPLKRHSSITHSLGQSKVESKDSPKKDVKRRNSSDPGIELTVEKKQIDLSLKIKSTLPLADKAKLKKKNEPMEMKRGPMKAFVPLGNMQRATGVIAPPATPPKRNRIPSPLKIATSTPDPSPIVLGKKTTKAKPVASSTPDAVAKERNNRSHIPQSPKATMSWNISPVTPNAKGNASTMFGDSDNTDNASSGKGYGQTPKKIESIKSRSSVIGGINRIKDKIIHGRRSEPLQPSPRGRGKLAPSPLNENNMIKVKPLNLNAKFRRRSGSLGNFEKENKLSST